MTPTLWLISGAVLCVAVLLFLRSPAPFSEPAEYRGTVRYIVDGDSLYVNGHRPQIRLWGVDAPESDHAGFELAKAKLTQLAQGERVICKEITRDRYGRTVARCFLPDGQEINRLMIESGTAKEYRYFTRGFYSGGN